METVFIEMALIILRNDSVILKLLSSIKLSRLSVRFNAIFNMALQMKAFKLSIWNAFFWYYQYRLALSDPSYLNRRLHHPMLAWERILQLVFKSLILCSLLINASQTSADFRMLKGKTLVQLAWLARALKRLYGEGFVWRWLDLKVSISFPKFAISSSFWGIGHFLSCSFQLSNHIP